MADTIKAVTYPVVNQAGEKVTTVKLSGHVFNIEPHKDAMFNAVQVYLSNRRQATAKTKDRSEVSGGGKKPWRQKGTGRARAGSSRSPIWVGGGVVFGPTGEQNYKLSMNKKEHNLALRSALSVRVADKSLIVVENPLELAAKTKEAVNALKAINAVGKIMIVAEENESLILATRNLPNVLLVTPNNVAVYDLLNVNAVVIDKELVKALDKGIGGLE